MTAAVRSLLFWLLMLALPLQGFAQAGMLNCHTSGEQTHAAHATPDHGMDHHAEHEHQQERKSQQSGCCACGPSCGVLALEVSASTPVLIQHDVFTLPSTLDPIPSTAPTRIDRPPKINLA